MSYIDLVHKCSQKNNFEYNHEDLFAQVNEAMKKSGAERAQALKEVMQKNYLVDAQKYEVMRRKAIYDSISSDVNSKEYKNGIKMREISAPIFLEDYVSIVEAMAKDLDENYEPAFMLGMSASDAKNLISAQLSSYSRYEEAEYRFKKESLSDALDAAWASGFPKLAKDQRDYSKFDEQDQGMVKETFIRKTIAEKELSRMGFFQKYFSSQGRAMRNYIKTAGQALKDVHFPKAAEKEAEFEYTFSVAYESEYQLYHGLIEEKFKEKQNEKNAEKQSITEEARKEILHPNKERISVEEAATSAKNTSGTKLAEPSITNKKTLNK